MPTINLTDALGLDLDGNLRPHTNLLKVLPAFPRLADLALDQVPVADLSAGLNLSEPIPIPDDRLSLTLDAGLSARLALIGPDQALDDSDPFGEIEIKANEFYLMLALKFSADAQAGAQIASLSLGFSPASELEILCYRRFERGAEGFPLFRKALAAAIDSFILPKDVSDLSALNSNTVLVLRGSGTLSVSAGVSVALPTESLASVSLPLDQKLQASAGGSLDVSADYTISGGYQVRLRRLEAGPAELGVYSTKSKEATLSVSAKVGLNVKAGPFDLGERFIRALSRQPVVDVAEFQQALPGENDEQKAARIESFQASIKAAISTKLQASASVVFDGLQAHEAVWTFEIDTTQASSAAASAALASALDGDFRALTADPRALPAGISQTSNIFTDTDLRKLSLKINLLGLVNLISSGKLVQVTTAERNANGDITLITDTSSESRLQALLVLFGQDGKRLRRLLSENFLIEASYLAKDLGVLPPDFKAKHTYFAIDGKTGRDELKNLLDVPRAFGLIPAEEAAQRLGTQNDFGRTDFYADAVYTTDAVREAFLQPQGLRPSTESYEQLGRTALAKLLEGDQGQAFRKKLAGDDAVWHLLRQDGNRANFAHLFGLPAGTLDPGVEAAGADFTAITAWAQAMTDAGSALRELDAMLGAGTVAPTGAKFEEARQLLKKRLGQVVAHTKEEFGDPLGMLMFYTAANRNAKLRVLLTGEKLQRLEVSSSGGLAAGASS